MGSAKTIMDGQPTNTFDQLAIKSRVAVLEYCFAARVGLWLCWLPIGLHIHSLPALLQRLKSAQNRHQKRSFMKMERAVEIVVRVCNLFFFQLPIFPRACLRRSLALYRTLGRMGYPVEFHLAVHKPMQSFTAHSWVTFDGKPVADAGQNDSFKLLYSYPSKNIADPNGGYHEKEKRSAAAT